MRTSLTTSLTASLALHGLAVGVIFCATIYVVQRDRPPLIFNVVNPPSGGSSPVVPPEPDRGVGPLKLTVPKPATPTAIPSPEVQAPPVSRSQPAAVLAKEPTRRPQSTAQRVAYQRTMPAAPKPAIVRHIDTQSIVEDLTRGPVATQTAGEKSSDARNGSEQDALAGYVALLRQALKDAHEPPPGVSDQLEAQVTFDITPSGAILNPRIKKSSGNKEFDESVLAAFRKVRSIGPTPNGKADTWTVGFKMKDEG